MVGGPAGKGVGGGVGVGEGGGGRSVAVGCSGESKGESNGDWDASIRVAVAVGVAVADGVGVALGKAGRATRPGVGEDGSSSVEGPQLERNAANAAAPAPRKNWRRSIGNLVFDMVSIVTASRFHVNHALATE